MDAATKTLADENSELKKIILQQQHLLTQKQQQIAQLLEQFRLQRHRQFGASSEQSPGQGHLFNEVEMLAAEIPDDGTEEAGVNPEEKKKPARGHRQPLPAELPRLNVIHDVSESQKVCACGCQRHVIGEVVSEQLDIIPAQVRVIHHIRKKYGCARCESAPVTAALPPQPIPKSNASPGLLAYIATAKYQDGLPLYRQETIFERGNIVQPRQTSAPG